MRTFWRLLGFLRPYRRAVLISFALAAVAMGTGVLIPYLVGRTVDEIRGGGADLWPLAIAVAVAGVLRLAFSVSRRVVAGTVSLGVEYDLRNRMYTHLQSLELAFFDGQQTGQLMSRATVDLQSVRFFLGYGLIFLAQSAITIVIAAVVMFALDPGLAAVALAPTPFIGFLPQLGLAALLLVGGRQVIDGSITVGEFIAFYGYVLMLTGPMRWLGMALGMAQRAVASGARVFELLDRDPRLVAAPDAQPLPAGGGRVEPRRAGFGHH